MNTASLPEVGGNYALYVDQPVPQLLAEKILEVLEMPEQERGLLAAEGKEWAKGFTWERTAIQTLQVLRSVSGKKR